MKYLLSMRQAELLVFFSLFRRMRTAWQLILQSVRGSPKRYIFCLSFLHMAELFSECYHNSEERAFALLVRKNQYWSKTTCLQLATEADAKSFFAHDGVQVSFTCPRALSCTQERTAQELNPNECIPLRTILGRRDSSLPLATDKEDIIPCPCQSSTIPLSPPSHPAGTHTSVLRRRFSP